MLEFFQWLCSDALLLDEWMLLLKAPEQKQRTQNLAKWFLDELEHTPQLLHYYLRFFPDAALMPIVQTSWNTFDRLTEKIRVLLELDQECAQKFLASVPRVHSDLPQLEKICAQKES